jgi:hypothetical protein
MDTEDRSRWLIAWHWHNPSGEDPIWSIMEAAKRMGGKITEAEASAITEEASITCKHLSADNLARFLDVKYAQRQALRLTTIGSVDVKKRARKELLKLRKRRALERKRRASGVRARTEYEAHSLSRTQPWRALGMSRAAWYRRNKARRASETSVSPPIFLSSGDRPVSPEEKEGATERGFASKEERGLPPSQTATTLAGDRYESLPLELRLAALCLPMPKIWCAQRDWGLEIGCGGFCMTEPKGSAAYDTRCSIDRDPAR